MKAMKKIISVCLLFCMILSVLVMLPAFAAEQTETAGSTAKEITSLSDLQNMEEDIQYYLTTDLVIRRSTALTGKSINTKSRTSGGTNRFYLDGRGHSILFVNEDGTASVSVRNAIFLYLGSGSVISNLTIGSPEYPITFDQGDAHIGAIAAQVQKSTTLSNVHVYCSIDNTKRGANNNYIGGLVGKVTGGTLTVENCTVNANYVSGATGAVTCFGGFVGRMQGTSILKVLNSRAALRIREVKTGHVGGILGCADAGVKYEIINSSAELALADAASCACAVGGIVGNNLIDGSKGDSVIGLCSYAVTGGDTAENTVFGNDAAGDETEKALGEHKLLITGMGKTFALNMVAGASVRLNAENPGLRFRTEISREDWEKLNGSGYFEGFGTVITPKALVEAAHGILSSANLNSVHGANSYVTVPFDPDQGWNMETEAAYSVTGSLAHITDYGMELYGLGFASVRINGVGYRLYADFEASRSRSVKAVAQMALDNAEADGISYTEDEMAVLKEFTTNTGYQSTALLTQVGLNFKNRYNGMSYVLRTEQDSFIVIDGGFAGEGEEDNIYQVLQSQTAKKKITIAAWILTHPHNDHIGAIADFIRKYGSEIVPQQVIFRFPAEDSAAMQSQCAWESYRTLTAALAEGGVWESAAVITPKMGDTLTVDGVGMHILHTEEHTHGASGLNAASMVFTLEVAGKKLLITGDLVAGCMQWLADTYGAALKCDILQAVHHASTHGSVAVYQEMVKPGETIVLYPTEYRRYWGNGVSYNPDSERERGYRFATAQGEETPYNQWLETHSATNLFCYDGTAVIFLSDLHWLQEK